MKILLISDSHGKQEYVQKLLNNKYDYVFYAGDGIRDLGINIYDPSVIYVKGNCDLFEQDAPITRTVFINDLKILITHGDYYKVKQGLESVSVFAKNNGYNMVCFGHTHTKWNECINETWFVNAGSLKNGNYAEIILKDKNISVAFKNICEDN